MFNSVNSIRRFSWFSLTLGLFLAACSNQPKGGESVGAMYFKGYGCINCHRIGGEGGAYGPDLTYIGFRKSPEWLDLWFKNPHAWKSNTPMPNFNLTDNVRKALVEYLSAQKGDLYRKDSPWNTPELLADSVKRGAVIYDRVGCVGCHGRNGVGGYPNNNVVGGMIPSLTKVAEGYSKSELEAKILTGVKPAKADISGPTPMIDMPEWGKVLKSDEIEALADYLISLKPKSTGSEAF